MVVKTSNRICEQKCEKDNVMQAAMQQQDSAPLTLPPLVPQCRIRQWRLNSSTVCYNMHVLVYNYHSEGSWIEACQYRKIPHLTGCERQQIHGRFYFMARVWLGNLRDVNATRAAYQWNHIIMAGEWRLNFQNSLFSYNLICYLFETNGSD